MKTRHLLVLIAGMIASAANRAEAQSDIDMVTRIVPPNVLLILDNSGSMAHSMWADDFDPTVFYDVGKVRTYCNVGDVPASPGSAGFCPASGDASGQCPDNESNRSSGSYVRCNRSVVPGSNCAATAPAGWSTSSSSSYCYYYLPDYTAGGYSTRWSLNYLSWLFSRVLDGQTPITPSIDRIGTAKQTLVDLIDSINPGTDENVRFGLMVFKPNNSANDPDGGTVSQEITTGNKAAMVAAINATNPISWTPLAETLAHAGEYMTGISSVWSCSGGDAVSPSNPMQDWCRKNFVILMTDGESTKDDFAHDQAGFMCAIGNADGDEDEVPSPYDGRSDAPPYSSTGTDWLDDVAYKYYNNDLRPDLQGTQNIVTYTVGFMVDHPLLRDAATNGNGEYYIASNADELTNALFTAVQDIIERSTSFTSTTVPSTRTSFGDGLFTASFVPKATSGFWEGDISAFRLSPSLDILDANGNLAVDATGTLLDTAVPFWRASERLLDPSHPPRSIYTTLGDTRQTFDVATIGATELDVQPTEISSYPNYPTVQFVDVDALSDALVRYLYGQDSFDEDSDGDTTDLREAIIGDIFHSNPLVVGPPPSLLRREEGFGPINQTGTFLNRYQRRDRRLYVGANDGMLHAIDAGTYREGDNPLTPEVEKDYYDLGTGDEVFAYIPGMLLDKVKMIPRNTPRSHYYVDGSPAVADAWFPSSPSDTTKDVEEWATVVMTGLRQGGDGYIAWDVTDPSGVHREYPRLLWELNDAGLPLGETWSDPILTRIKVRAQEGFGDHCGSDDGEGDCREQWVAVVGGGFRANADPNLAGYVPGSLDGDSRSVLVIALDSGSVVAQLAYDASDPVLSKMNYAIPSTPAVLDLNSDGFADLIYIGDTGGQLWKWDISSVAEDSNSDNLIDNWTAGIFFDAGSVSLPSGGRHHRGIFFQPVVARSKGRLILAFGTGERSDIKYAGHADGTVDDMNRFYVIRDPNPQGSGAIPIAPYSEANLTDVTALGYDTDPTDLGYYVVAEKGEKFITNHVVFRGSVITASYIPDDGSGGVCGTDGSAYLYIFDLVSGAASGESGRRLYLGVGVPSDPRISVGDTAKIFTKTSAGQIQPTPAPDGGGAPVELIYWRQRF
jgi:type IV pilus assembly protein PilY1